VVCGQELQVFNIYGDAIKVLQLMCRRLFTCKLIHIGGFAGDTASHAQSRCARRGGHPM